MLDGAHAQGVLRLLQDASAAGPEAGEAFDISQPAAGGDGDEAPRARDPRTVSAIELMTGRPVQTPATEAAEDDTSAEPGFVGKGKRVRCALAGPDGAPLKKLKADGTKEESSDSENEARRSNAGGEMTITYSAASALRARARERRGEGKSERNFGVTFPLFRVGGRGPRGGAVAGNRGGRAGPEPMSHSFHVPAAPMAPLASYRSLISRFLPPPSEGRRMLVVDDSHTVRCFLQRTFETKGFQVDVATNSWQALTQMQSHMYDIVFLDLEMPVMNGYRCAQRSGSGKGAQLVPCAPSAPAPCT